MLTRGKKQIFLEKIKKNQPQRIPQKNMCIDIPKHKKQVCASFNIVQNCVILVTLKFKLMYREKLLRNYCNQLYTCCPVKLSVSNPFILLAELPLKYFCLSIQCMNSSLKS